MAEPTTKPLEEMTKDELFAEAQRLEIPGRYDMKKAELLAAVEEVLTAPPKAAEGPDAESSGPDATVETGDPAGGGAGPDSEATNPVNEKPEKSEANDTQPPDPESDAAALAAQNAELEAKLIADAQERERKEREDEANAEAKRAREAQQAAEAKEAARAAAHAAGQLTEDDRVRIMRADDHDLLEIAAQTKDDPKWHFVYVAVLQEQERRVNVAKQGAASRQLMQSPDAQFKITAGPKDMRYVSPSAYVTTLPLGCIVSPLTHDMQHLQQQGFEWAPIAGVQLGEDQLGNPVSVAQ